MEKLSKTDHLKALGKDSSYKYEGADISLLEKFPNPMKLKTANSFAHAETKIKVVAPEFTSLCPLTGQPDFATIIIEYIPREWCVESKSWKLFLGSFRQVGEFHESCVTRITQALVDLLDPEYLKVEGQFTPRGGIPFWPTFEYWRNE
jgi:7-cyano-7-deazaguanine reductase